MLNFLITDAGQSFARALSDRQIADDGVELQIQAKRLPFDSLILKHLPPSAVLKMFLDNEPEVVIDAPTIEHHFLGGSFYPFLLAETDHDNAPRR